MSSTANALFQQERANAAAKGGARVTFSPSLVIVNDPTGAAAESIRALRTHLMAQHIAAGRRALAICAPETGVGCTFVAANLAVACAQIGLNTVLVDANLRDPAVHQIIRPEHLTYGLRHHLDPKTNAGLDDIQGSVMPNLSVIFSGGAAQQPQDLLAGARFRELMAHCMRSFDITIADTAAGRLHPDARQISAACGYSLMVAKSGKSMYGAVKALVNEIETDRAHVIGTVLNEG